MIQANIPISQDQIDAFCRKWKVKELSLFGSILREDFGPASDVDVLVSFETDAPWSLYEVVDMEEELRELFGRNVDFVMKEGLRNPFRRREILSTRQVIYGG